MNDLPPNFMKSLARFRTLAHHEADHHQDATMFIKNQHKDSCYNREKTTRVSTFAANPAKRLGPHGDAGLSFISQCIES